MHLKAQTEPVMILLAPGYVLINVSISVSIRERGAASHRKCERLGEIYEVFFFLVFFCGCSPGSNFTLNAAIYPEGFKL